MSFKLLLIILISGFFRFFKLDWGQGYFFHPDEYHLAAAVERLSFPRQMNPELFSYGSLTVYLIYFTKLLLAAIGHTLPAIIIGRFYAALFSTLTIILVYLIARRLFPKQALLAAALSATLPGLIQQAHFATPESNLTFWLFLFLYLGMQYQKTKKLKFLYLAAASFGLALATKITVLFWLPILLFFVLTKPFLLIEKVIVPLFLAGFVFFCAFPYSLLDYSAFSHSLNYETGVGRGQPVVFYTRQFINTLPVLFQFQKILPYALGPAVLLLGTIGFFLAIRNPNWRLVVAAFLLLFLPHAFLFAKWTRFIAPSFPFFAIFTAYLYKKIKNKFLLFTFYFLLFTNFLWTLIFFSIYLRPDVRITATDWLNANLPAAATVLTESGNMLEVPLTGSLKKVGFDFYHLDEQASLRQELPGLLAEADYFIVQSRRMFSNHQRLPNQFPLTSRFYDLLFANQLGFLKIKELSSYPLIPDEMAEETWSVFDHPVIRIYQKTQFFTENDYESLLEI